MDHNPPRPPLRSATSSSSFSRISTVSDFTDLDSFQSALADSQLQTQPSPASLQTSGVHVGTYFSHEGYTYASPTSSWASFTGPSHFTGYSPVASTDRSLPYSPGRSHAHRHYAAIPEEEDGIDLGLISSAAPVSSGGETEMSEARAASTPMFDFTSTLGPTTQADEAFIQALQQQEAQGRLTGGLGAGIKTDLMLTESALLASSPVSERPLSRTFSRVGRPVSRTETVRRLGQSAANRRGEVIEVVMEDHDAGASDDKVDAVDVSLVSGPDAGDPVPFVMRQTTFPTSKATTAVFYPQPNWKPFSMRWPYLLFLIVLSLGLGAGVEMLYRWSAQTPLVSFRSPSEIPAAQYFAVKFLPMIIAVSYGVLWQITNFDVMRLEPFYQLSKEGGALAAESLNVDYLTQFNLFRPLRALHYRHYAVALSSVASLLANTLVPTLGAASIILTPDRDTRLRSPNIEKHILLHHVWSRLLTATFAIIAFLGCILFCQLQTRRSGLLADVKGIAGLASMATVSHILMDFKDTDVATHQDIHNKLKNRRYVLRNSALAPDDSRTTNTTSTNANPTAADRYTRNHLSANPQPLMLRPLGALPFLAALVGFTALLPTVLFTPATALADRAPWLVTALAVVLKLSWGALETDVRLLEPYVILARRHAAPATLALDYTTMPVGWVAVKAAVHRHWVVFWVGVGTLLAEVLTVLVTSLVTGEGKVFGANGGGGGQGMPAEAINAGQETVPSFWLSLALALLILLYMIATAGAVFARRRRVFMPRQPNTIASVLAYIHQSKMLYDFVGTSKFSAADMVRRLEARGKTYGLGWFRGRDGQSHCGVDEEELLSEYKPGYDYSRATKPWEEAEVNWL
ncbi:62bb5e34-0fbd-43c3-aaf1-ad40301baea8 [Thermothielavioides terrestris]|uniref:62bb5e34-0fbd-43c3-aaf1-ad40301baea8 n=1 Tax=Thermothielavioides terrestris TaxID=2587410 RepID=A0A3S4B5B2_9PEZI|nr:62bb5e34-0fbd-43c3-aaf1-ad40301baea8 [Thermothielavioides terrestris]